MVLTLTLVLAHATALPAWAQASKQVIGEVVRPVNAQAGAGETSYPVLRLQPGERVTVVAIKFDRWLQIAPPEGSYCLVPAGHVTRNGNAGFPSEGTAVRDLNVRIASQINDSKWDFAPSRITAGSKLTILGETDDAYYRIPPPADVFYYVPKDALQPVGTTDAPGNTAQNTPPQNNADETPPSENVANVDPADVTDMPDESMDESADTTDPAMTDATDTPDVADAPATDEGGTTRTPLAGEGQPGDAVAGNEGVDMPATRQASLSSESAAGALLALEQRFNEEIAKPIDDQNLDALATEYADLIEAGELGAADSDLAALRVDGLEKRRAAIAQYKEVQKMRQEMEQQQAEIEAANAENAARLEAANLKNYAAVGVLRTSKLRLGRQALYRLTDPNTGRTLVYVRAEPGEMAALMTERLGTFVGIDGALVEDPRINLSYLTPMAIDTVDPSEVYKSITADMVPPTLTRGS